MIQQDYIMRMIEQLGAFLSALTGKKGPINLGDVNDQLGDYCTQWLGLPLSMMIALPEEEIRRLLAMSDRDISGKCLVLAEILRIRALLASDPEEVTVFVRKSLYFYGHTETLPAEMESEKQLKMQELKDKL